MSIEKDPFSSFGPNAGYLTELYQLFLSDPSLVEPAWANFFHSLGNGTNGNGHLVTEGEVFAQSSTSRGVSVASKDVFAAERLVDSYRRYGHAAARINPLGSSFGLRRGSDELSPARCGFDKDPGVVSLAGFSFGGREVPTLGELLSQLDRTYCGSVGFEFMHLTSSQEREWLRVRIEGRFPEGAIDSAETRQRILAKLIDGDLFESELHRKYVGTKRFSLEGSETLIPYLDRTLSACAAAGVREVIFGMAHRGRLNVLSNTLGKPLEMVFSEFEDQSMATVVGAGDVKYHLGFHGTYRSADGGSMRLEMVPNPSHLEFVNPVVEGVARAAQDLRYEKDRKSVVPLLMHGDAAFAGQGVVFETINYAGLNGYATGGTIHIVINNQIGFTTTPDEARSTSYCTDLAKGADCPVFHVNCEDPDAACWVAQLAVEYRNEFGKDVFVDLIGYRRHGHNEGDDPSFTQPLIYSEIKTKKPVWQLYGAALVSEGACTEEQLGALVASFKDKFATAQNRMVPPAHGEACSIHGRLRIPSPETGVGKEELLEIAHSLTKYPDGFVPHPKLHKILEKRVESVVTGEGIEWGVAEGLAFGSLVREGRHVRLSGQDCGRGTFSQRHLMLDHFESPITWSPLQAVALKAGKGGEFEVYNSSLSEAAVLGFEFGYSATDTEALTIWEAQFGDFSNGAQVIIDQFLSSSEAKWGQLSGVTLMLPHAYEGQGPEHSSARLERYLQLCGEGNMVVCYPSTAAQHFHLLRRQGLIEIKRPLVVMTPKSLLRLPSASASISELTSGNFKTVIEDDLSGGGKIERIVMLTGKVYHDVMPALRALGEIPVKVVRVEQLHPFPQFEFKKVLKGVTKKRVIWVQEEPQNMGAWSYVQPYLEGKLGLTTTYVGRDVSASTATGSPKHHAREQKAILDEVVRLVKGG